MIEPSLEERTILMRDILSRSNAIKAEDAILKHEPEPKELHELYQFQPTTRPGGVNLTIVRSNKVSRSFHAYGDP